MKPLRLIYYDIDPKSLEEAKDADSLARAGSVMIAGDHYDPRIGKHFHKSGELLVSVDNRRIRGANAVKHVSANENHIGLQLNCLVDRLPECDRHVGFALIHTG